MFINPLSQEEGGVVANPLSDFSSWRFFFCLDTHVTMKKMFKNICRENSWEVGGGCGIATNPKYLREGVAAKINNFP